MSSFREIRPGTYEFTLELGYDSKGERIRKYRNRKCKNDREAKKIMARLEVELMDGILEDPNRMTFENLYEKWKVDYAPYTLDQNTQETYELVIDASLLPVFGKAKIQKLLARDLIKYFNDEKKKGVGQYTLEKRHRCLRSLFRFATKFEYIQKDISLEVPKPPVVARKKDYYDEDEIPEVFEVIASCLPHQRLMITLALEGGLRRGEVLAIDMYKDIDEKNCGIDINKSLQQTKKQGLRIKVPKNGEGRFVTLDEMTMEELLAYRSYRETEKELLGDEYEGFKTEKGKHVDLLFGHPNGKPFVPNSVSQFWRRIVDRYDLKKIAFHDLRHSSASYLLSQGYSVKVVQERLGHKDYQTTMNIYAHVSKKMNQEAGNAFSRLKK